MKDMEKTFWKSELEAVRPSLGEDVRADVAVIGGGLAGIACAYELARRGKKTIVLEADRVGRGETWKSSAMVTFAHDLIYRRLISKHGRQVAAEYLARNKRGLEIVASAVEREGIDCDFTRCDMVLFAETGKGEKQLTEEMLAYSMLGEKAEFTEESELPFAVRLALRVKNQARLNPYAYVTGLARAFERLGGRIFERTRVIDQPEKGVLKVGRFAVQAEKFVVATHFPYIDVPGFYFAAMYQSRSHNMVFRADVDLKDMYESAEEDGFEYRSAGGGAVLCGGGQVRTGKYRHRSYFSKVEREMLRAFPGASEAARFSAQDCMTFDLLPFIGKYSDFLPDVLVVTGFGKWGFTASAAAAEIIADVAEGKDADNPFSPDRAYYLRAPIKSLRNAAEVVSDFAGLVLSPDAKKLSRIQPGQGAVVRMGFKRVGVYRDKKGGYRAIAAVCPHLGCALKWNKDECTWDCPCHGSRFAPDGTVLSSPATAPAEKVKIEKTREKNQSE